MSKIWPSPFLVAVAFVGIFPFSYLAYHFHRKEVKIVQLSNEFHLLGLNKPGDEDKARTSYNRVYSPVQYTLYISLIILVSVIVLRAYEPLFGSLPTVETPSSAEEAASPTNEAVSPTNEAVSPTDEAASTADEAASTADEAASTADEAASSADEAASTPTEPPVIPNKRNVVSLVFLGFLGAYVYSVLELIRRYNTFDLLPQVYASILVRMVAAIILVFVGALAIFNSASTYVPPTAAPGYATIWLPGIIAFVIGAFPKRGLDWFQRLADPVLSGRTAATPGVLPLENLQGISTWHASRLEQMGIDDAQNLAGVDIAELLITTQFDAKVIVHWIDQAILYVKVGADIDKFRANKIPTFSELKRRVTEFETDPPGTPEQKDRLASRLGLDSFTVLRALAADADFPNYHHLEAYYSRAPLAAGYWSQEALDRLLGSMQFEDFEEAIKYDSNATKHEARLHPRLQRLIGNAYYQRAKLRRSRDDVPGSQADLKRATDLLDDALKQEPESAETYHALGLCSLEKALAEKALDEKNAALTRAAENFTQAIAHSRGFAEAFNARATAHITLKHMDLAMQDLDEAVRLDDRLALAYFNRGNLRNRLGEFDAAMNDFELSYRCGYGDIGCIKLGMGIAQLGLGSFGNAVQSLTIAIRHLPESRLPETYLTRAQAYRGWNQMDNAMADLQWIIARDCDYTSRESREAYKMCRQLAMTRPQLAGSCGCQASEAASTDSE